MVHLKMVKMRTFLVVQRLRLSASTAGVGRRAVWV